MLPNCMIILCEWNDTFHIIVLKLVLHHGKMKIHVVLSYVLKLLINEKKK